MSASRECWVVEAGGEPDRLSDFFRSAGDFRTIRLGDGIGVIGDPRVFDKITRDGRLVNSRRITSKFKLVSREVRQEDAVVDVGEGPGAAFGGGGFSVIAGPCGVESHDQVRDTAEHVAACGAHALRGGAFKPRTSPHSFQGLGEEGLRILSRVRDEIGLPIVTEVVNPGTVGLVSEHADCLQVGARSMQNFALLLEAGRQPKPVLLKRGMSATLAELLLAAEYVVSEGNQNVILCERGIRTFETATRNTLDLSAVPWLKRQSYLPVIVDPSHGTGVRELVVPMALAAVAAGADGAIIEVHRDPGSALSDGGQSLTHEQFSDAARMIRRLAECMSTIEEEL